MQLVKLLRAGEPVKMSKRAGEFVTLREVINEVGRDAVRFMMLFRKNDAVLEFDLAKVIEQSRDNPVFLCPIRLCARAVSVFETHVPFSPICLMTSGPWPILQIWTDLLTRPNSL